MKKVLSALVALIMVLSLVPVFAEVTLQGSGTEESPYLIGTEAELKAFRDLVNRASNGTFPNATLCAKLTGDITLTADWGRIGTYDNGGYFSGTFDGNGYTISGYDRDGGSQYGFVGYSKGATIKNLTISAADGDGVKGYHQFGIFVGRADADADRNPTTLINCAAYGNVITTGGQAGGLVGAAGNCVTQNCYFVGNVSGTGEVAGVGKECVATNCFAYGTITTSAKAYKVTNKADSANIFYLSSNGTGGNYGYGTQMSDEAFKSGEVTYLLNSGSETDIFGQNLSENGDSHPVFFKSGNRVGKIKDAYKNVADDWTPPTLSGGGTEDNPYLIDNKEVLELFRDTVNAGQTNICAKLTADIDLENEKWTPIGNATNKYSGIFDGNGYEIKNIVNKGNKWGFFGETDGGTIKNLTIRAGSDGEEENTLSAFGHECGLFIGIASNDTVLDHCAGFGNLTGYGEIGGLTGKGDCIVTNSYFVGDIYGSSNVSGMGYKAKATNCFVFGKVDAKVNAFKVCNGSATNCYYLSSTGGSGLGGYGTQKSENAFANGEVAYLLSETFGQLLGRDLYPVWKTEYNVVEAVLNGYANTYAVPAVGNVEFIRADGTAMSADSVSMYTDEIIIHFTSEMDEASMTDAVQLDGVDFEGELSEDKTDYVLKVTAGVIPWGEYTLIVKSSATNSLGNSLAKDCVVEFTVTDGVVAIITSAVVGDGTSLNSIKNGETVNLTISGYNPRKAKQKMTVILMGYKTVSGVKEMTASVVKPVEIPENGVVEIDKTVTIDPVGFADAEEVKIFVWGYPVQTSLTSPIFFN